MKNKTTAEFIGQAIERHGTTYNYSLVNYIDAKTKVQIICPIHEMFKQIPASHLRGRGCLKCGGKYSYTTSEFIELANIKHKNKYDYSKTKYQTTEYTIIIICPIHGDFIQRPIIVPLLVYHI
jgi:hypothetical protein